MTIEQMMREGATPEELCKQINAAKRKLDEEAKQKAVEEEKAKERKREIEEAKSALIADVAWYIEAIEGKELDDESFEEVCKEVRSTLDYIEKSYNTMLSLAKNSKVTVNGKTLSFDEKLDRIFKAYL